MIILHVDPSLVEYILTISAAEASLRDQTATQEDLSRIIKSLEIRDRRIQQAEAELRRITEEHRKLRDELLPVFKIVKDQWHPLPYHPTSSSPNLHSNHGDMVSPMGAQTSEGKSGGLSRKFSAKRLFLGPTPKNSSPTHAPQSAPSGKPMADASILDPSAAALAASSHLIAGINGGAQPATSPNQPNIPSPTSPNNYAKSQLPSRSYGNIPTPSTARPVYALHDDYPSSSASTLVGDSRYPSSNASTLVGDARERSNPTPTPANNSSRIRPPPRETLDEPPSSGSRERETPGVEIFKSFRVSMEDPCHKVLPAALKKYNINADWRQYALYIVYGDQERCLGLEEKPLILFKQLAHEERKPMFMLRKHAAPTEGHSGPRGGSGGSATGSTGFEASAGMGSGRGHGSSIQLPGGVL